MAGTTDEAREALDTLHAKVEAIKDADGWREYLAVVSRFHSYSLNNAMWLWSQWETRRAVHGAFMAMSAALFGSPMFPALPEATQFAAFSTWRDLDRPVRKGEKGLSVLCPVIIKDREDLDENGKPREKLIGWRLRSKTFEVSQTTGAPLPENPAAPSLLTGDADPAAWDAVVALAEHLGCTVHLVGPEALGGANGNYSMATRVINVLRDNDGAQRFKTLVHEVAHHVLHGTMEGREGLSRAEMEVEAESTAYVVAALLGFDTAAYSVGYVATWEGREDHGKLLAKTAKRVLDAARTIADGIAAQSVAVAA